MHGSWDSLNVEIFDFNRVTIDQGTTVHDLYAQAGLLGNYIFLFLWCLLSIMHSIINLILKSS